MPLKTLLYTFRSNEKPYMLFSHNFKTWMLQLQHWQGVSKTSKKPEEQACTMLCI